MTLRHIAMLAAATLVTAGISFARPAAASPGPDSLAAEIFGYAELPDPDRDNHSDTWAAMSRDVRLSWATTDTRHAHHAPPAIETNKVIKLKAWRGERVSAQAVLWTKRDLGTVHATASPLKRGRTALPDGSIKAGWVKYVMTDELNKDGNGGCGHRPDKTQWDSLLVADPIPPLTDVRIEAETTRPLWLTIEVPRDAAPATYHSTVTVSGEGLKPMRLRLELEVLEHTLPHPSQWHTDLDLWQNPYAVARYYGVPLWSDAHFAAMRPIMQMLARAGQRSVTASIMHRPWDGQTRDHYDSMVGKTRHIDGTWSYDYTVFDRWVTFMADECGIDGRISCYTMVPWALSFDYYDQATSRVMFVKAEPGDTAFSDYWLPFLRDFARHLRLKGWFDKTYISMDERPLDAMQAAISVIKEADPEYKIALAGNYHSEIQADLDYLCIPFGQDYPPAVLADRRAKGQTSAYYTCCTEAFPNIFTFSPPAEAAWTAVHTVAGGYDGYLRWSVMSWTDDPLRDSRFHTWAAGDTYCIYPGPMSSIRFERLLEGLQMCEKIHILRREFAADGDEAALRRLDTAVALFTPDGMAASGISAETAVCELGHRLNDVR